MARLFSKKIMFLILAIIVSFFTLKQFFGRGSHPMAGHHGQAMPVSVAQVLEKDVQQWHEFSGRLVATEQVDIRPRVSGTIDAIHFHSGAIVKKGDLLFSIDSRPFAAEMARAQGAYASAEAQVMLSNSEFERAQKLIKDKVISQSEFDMRKNAFKVNQALLKSAKAALETAKINLEYTQIKSPITGKISRPEITIGNLIDAGSPVLATVVSSTPIYADFEMDEQTFLQYAKAYRSERVKINQIPVMMGLATEDGTPHIGHIESFDNHLNSASGTIRIRAVFNNEDGALVPGFFARVKLGNTAMSRSILITDRAVGTDQNKKFVLVVGDDNKVNYREIKLGTVVQGMRVVLDGLAPGEKIVVNGLQRARPGSEVIPEIVSMEQKQAAIPEVKEKA
jgi:multidrug efflux system membrane fusion protein